MDREARRAQIEAALQPFYKGRIERVSGVLVEARGVPAAVGELCTIRRAPGDVRAEVVGFRGDRTLLMPYGDLAGIAPLQPVVALGRPFSAPVGAALLGRVVSGFGEPLDAGPALDGCALRSVRAPGPAPLERAPITAGLSTGIRAIDALATLGRGQRLGIFAGSGVGKSSLLGQITRGTDADVTVVALVGERGREVRAFVDDVLGAEGRRKSVMVVATSDRPPIERYLAPFVAVTVAESFRDQGADVLLVMDSVTRFAAAAREIGLAAGEPPTVRGYPPSFFATVPKLVERMGRTHAGTITGLVTILLDADDPNDPVADTMRGLLDGHLLLDRQLASQGHYPAVDVLGSLSRLMPAVASPEHLRTAQRVRELLAAWRSGRDLVEIGAYKPGSNRELDLALRLRPALDAFLRQGPLEHSPLAETLDLLARLSTAASDKP
jgi:flagellum-specific ATP synthase